MTEAEWLMSKESRELLYHLRGRVSDRKLRLVACACCRLLWSRLSRSSRRAVEVAEQLADGPVSEQVHDAVVRAAIEAVCTAGAASVNAADMAYKSLLNDGWYAADWTVGCGTDGEMEAAVLRDVIGNPFRTPPAIEPFWLIPEVVAVARRIYEERDVAAMPVLADALEDAGCNDEELLRHCRQQGEHVRGCWVVDALLAKV
jgi:hypothetical protein